MSNILNYDELPLSLSTTYTKSLSDDTQNKRLENINALKAFIDEEKNANGLAYSVKEERVILFETHKNEQISIQFPGKESVRNDDKRCPYDTRPKIVLKNGDMLRDLVFADMWGIVEKINEEQHKLVRSLSALFFRMGRMVDHCPVSEDYQVEVVDIETNEVIKSYKKYMSWNKLSLPDNVIDSFNMYLPSIELDDFTISFEAFIYFFDLILHNEDIKYNYKKGNLSSGRVPTSDSMLLLASCFDGQTTISSLLQRFVSGMGVGRILPDEIPHATGGLINIVDPKANIIEKISALGLSYDTSYKVYADKKTMTVTVAIPDKKIAFLDNWTQEKETALIKKGWTVYSLQKTLSEDYMNRLLAYIKQ